MIRFTNNESSSHELNTPKFAMTVWGIGRVGTGAIAAEIMVVISDLEDSYTR